MKHHHNSLKYLIIFTTAASSILLGSCKKYLDYQSPSTLTLAQTFENVGYTNSQVIGIYTELAGTNGYGNQLSITFPQGTDDFISRSTNQFDPTGSYAFSAFGVSKDNLAVYNTMVQLYNGIERANIACKYIPASNLYNNGTAAQKRQLAIYYGEALTLRALFFSELIRNWGDVPASFVPAADLPSNFTKNVNRDSTYDHILNDLQLAENLVPWRDSLPAYGDFRITKGAVKGLRARIALACGGYSLSNKTLIMDRRPDYLAYYRIAFNECLDIINSGRHGLNPVYENIFKSLHGSTRYDDNNELMFEVAMFGQVNDSYMGHIFGLSFVNTPSWASAGGGPTAVPTYLFEFDTLGRDSRREVTIAYFKVQADATGATNVKLPIGATSMNCNKFRKSWTAFTSTYTGTLGINWPIIRYADVLLMYAEAANELQDFSGSISPLQALQLVQQRAYGSNAIPTTPTGHDDFFKAIVKERLLEFGGEGIRKYDLVRWRLLGKKITETKDKLALFAYGAPVPPTGNPYASGPDYLYAVTTPFYNGTCKSESDSLKFNGGGPNAVFFKPSSVSTTPAAFPNRVYWRKDGGTYDATTGKLTSAILYDQNGAYALMFVENAKELLPYSAKFLNENRGGVIQNHWYQTH
ncbi:RagB/SusD family nutrient uptake outer membrane protein [Parasediminibacterium sp. JCM 36343]|uniref:RagB/SusD family nutrient uptake outer membrane protein n=1 Tax=Parasediminibacterium sp. JCM 36343 TaxID=3374279 RepID=UPI003979DC6C